jgi:hypothetical protein
MFLHVEGFQVEVKPALLPWEAATVHEFRLGEKIGLNELVNFFWVYNFLYFEQNITTLLRLNSQRSQIQRLASGFSEDFSTLGLAYGCSKILNTSFCI